MARLKAVTALVQTRMAHLSEAPPLVRPSSSRTMRWRSPRTPGAALGDNAAEVIEAAGRVLGDIDDHGTGVPGSDSGWTAEAIETALRTAIVDGPGIAEVRLRSAADRRLGARISPPLFESMEILGKTSTLNRLAALLATL